MASIEPFHISCCIGSMIAHLLSSCMSCPELGTNRPTQDRNKISSDYLFSKDEQDTDSIRVGLETLRAVTFQRGFKWN